MYGALAVSSAVNAWCAFIHLVQTKCAQCHTVVSSIQFEAMHPPPLSISATTQPFRRKEGETNKAQILMDCLDVLRALSQAIRFPTPTKPPVLSGLKIPCLNTFLHLRNT